MKHRIAVFGGSRADPESEAYRVALDLGRALGRSGYDLVNGGFGGTMEAAACGARENGARVTGVTLDLLGKRANAYLHEEIRTRSIWERTQKMLDIAEGSVVLPGATGTLAELGLAWELMNKGMLAPRPLVFLGTYWHPLVDLMRSAPEAASWPSVPLRVASGTADAVRFLDDFFGRTALA